VKYVGLDWAYRTAQWCALAPGGELAGEGRIAADRDGLARLVLELGTDIKACLEMMSGALWVLTSSSPAAGRSRLPMRAG
jgi:hypothetical protein